MQFSLLHGVLRINSTFLLNGYFHIIFSPNEILFPNRSNFHFELGGRTDMFGSRQIRVPQLSLPALLFGGVRELTMHV